MCQEAIDKANAEILRYEGSYKEDLTGIITTIIVESQKQNQIISERLDEVRSEIDRLSRGFRRLLSGDAIKKNKELESKIIAQLDEKEKALDLWIKTRESIKEAEILDTVMDILNSRKITKEKNAAVEYLGEYRRKKREVFEQTASISKLASEIAEDEIKRDSEELLLNHEEFTRILELRKNIQRAWYMKFLTKYLIRQ
jgi:hypothetical protein